MQLSIVRHSEMAKRRKERKECYKIALFLTPRTTSLTTRSHIVILSISSNDPFSLVSIFRSNSPRRALASSSSASVEDARDTQEDWEEYAVDIALLGGDDGYPEWS